ncbi:MAG TPA: methyl-accepting chemotaxis protein [Rectinemataceae bacterium]|nr:methyl-accepting chemotaxis protein [Rectinemataceae bacterium]
MSIESKRENFALIREIRKHTAFAVFGIIALFLFSSELLDSIFNNSLDARGFGLGARILFSFKPVVIALYGVLCVTLYATIMWYLRPLLRYLANGQDHQRARVAAVNVPWVIIIFQLAGWTIGTLLYYSLEQWRAESGIPFWIGLLLKLGTGLPAGVYLSIVFNLILIPTKRRLGIVEMHRNENDLFSRWRDLIAVAAAAVFMTVNYSYIIYYFSKASVRLTFADFYGPLVVIGFVFTGVSVGLIVASKAEYRVQIESIQSVLREMAAGRAGSGQRIQILNFNELGQTASYVNVILDDFANMLARISDTSNRLAESSQRLSVTGQENAAHSNQQAASTAEIVSTMENLDRLSSDIGRQVKQVEDQSVRMKEGVYDGSTITKENIAKMQELSSSYSGTIDAMNSLGAQIVGIWEIVKIITGIAGQIKIIAFNAALEASSAGEAGRNFEIVAGEIRRLADSTVSSTNEIRAKIGDIQRASDAVVVSSESDTLKIQDAREMSLRLEKVFETILDSSETSSESAMMVRTAVEQQIGAFEQVLATLRQIAEGIRAFAGSIEETSVTTDALRGLVEDLNSIVERAGEREAK